MIMIRFVTISIALLLLFNGINLLGQTYSYFPTSNAFWSAMHCEPGPMVAKSGFVKVGVFGDTVINSKTYHKLYLQRKYVNFTFSCDTCGFVFVLDSAFYFMSYREENKIIYFVPQQNAFNDPPGTEYPIFDFNLTRVGETILGYEYMFLPYGSSQDPTPIPGCGVLQDTVTLTVESIDSVEMSDGSYRRRINFKPLTYGLRESWIEGIGSTKGFGLSLNVTNSNNTMVCFSHNGINLETAEILSQQLCTRYPDSTITFAGRCEYTEPTLVEDFTLDNDKSVFPNPFIHSVKFTGLKTGDKITIYNLFGQLVFEGIPSAEEFEPDNIEYEKGIYIYIITSSNNEIICGKVVKY
ncbi:MAG: T9SS type A sorting domain-containing protein [bacterium]